MGSRHRERRPAPPARGDCKLNPNADDSPHPSEGPQSVAGTADAKATATTAGTQTSKRITKTWQQGSAAAPQRVERRAVVTRGSAVASTHTTLQADDRKRPVRSCGRHG